MKVNFFASLRQVVGQKTVEMPIVEGMNARQLVEAVVCNYPALERELLDEHRNLYQHVQVVVNGREVRYLEGSMERVLTSDDRVSIFPAIGGG
jgi:molybdopterin synthase sulfur carrier subunit